MNRLASAPLHQTANPAEKIFAQLAALVFMDRQKARVVVLASVRLRRKRWPVARGIS